MIILFTLIEIPIGGMKNLISIMQTDNTCITLKQADKIMDYLQTKEGINFPEYNTQYQNLSNTLIEREKIILGI